VPSEHGEDDVLVAVTATPGHRVDPEALVRFCAERMAHFMVPRYVRVVDALPMTATNKVQKHLLRAEGVTADTFDREAAGIRITRDRIGSHG
jgi:crotonobetaine/carnitine-CoA ligase